MSLRNLKLDTSWGELLVSGGSRAGDGTLVLLPQLRLALDPGRPHRALPRMSTVLVSHGHLDHVGGLAYWASQRFLNSMGPGTVVAPADIAGAVTELLALHARLEGGRPYEVEVAAVRDGDRHALRRDLEVRFFATDHWVPTLGSLLVWRKHHLRPELAGLSGEEIAGRRQAGEEVTQEVEIPLLAYCADTGPGLFDAHPESLAAEVLLLECSFFRPSDRARARTYGHLHLDDLLAAAPGLACRHLVLLHPSRRHRLAEVTRLISERIAPAITCPVHSLAVDWE